MPSSVHLIILQHPQEARHAKNTAHLIRLCAPNTTIYLGESTSDFKAFQAVVEQSPEDYALIYPSEQSSPLEQHANAQKGPLPFKHLVFIDATWRKAFKIWQLNPWLATLKGFHFSSPPKSQYAIRKAPGEHNLSTLEAAAYALEAGFNEDTSALHELFQAMQRIRFAKHQSQRPTGGGQD